MRLFLITLILTFSVYRVKGQEYSKGDKGLYIFEYSSKILGQSILSFIETNDTIALRTTFKIYYNRKCIRKVKKTTINSKYKYQKRNDGNIYVYGLDKICYNSINFKVMKRNSIDFYKQLSLFFLDMDNYKKIEVLNKLSQ